MLKGEEIVLREGVSFSNDGNEVDTSAEAFHNLNVKWFQSVDR